MCIYIIVFIRKIHIGSSVTIDTPSHRQSRILLYYFHFLHRTMTGLTSLSTGVHVLLVTKINVIWQIMYYYLRILSLNSFLRFSLLRIDDVISLLIYQLFII